MVFTHGHAYNHMVKGASGVKNIDFSFGGTVVAPVQ
jgi:hypothetical protein